MYPTSLKKLFSEPNPKIFKLVRSKKNRIGIYLKGRVFLNLKVRVPHSQ